MSRGKNGRIRQDGIIAQGENIWAQKEVSIFIDREEGEPQEADAEVKT